MYLGLVSRGSGGGSESHDRKECFNEDEHDDDEEMNKSVEEAISTHTNSALRLYRKKTESWKETTFLELVSTFNMIIVIIMMI